MTTFRLNAGRPTAYPSGGSSAFNREQTADVADDRLRRRDYIADTVLKCGDTIPWPIIHAFGDTINLVWCSVHGWQPKITKAEIARVRKDALQCRNSPSQSTLTLIPPTSEDSVPF